MNIINHALIYVLGSIVTNIDASLATATSTTGFNTRLRGNTITDMVASPVTTRYLKQPANDDEEPIVECDETLFVEVQNSDNSDEPRIECSKHGVSYSIDIPKEVVKKNKHGVANNELELDLPQGTKIDKAKGKIKIPKGEQASMVASPPGLNQNKIKFKAKKKSKDKSTPWTTSNRRRLTTGTKTVLVVRVVATDSSTTASAEQLSDSVFGTNGDLVNLKTQYAACSHNQLQFQPATGIGITNGNQIVDGATTVTINRNALGVSDGIIRNAVTSALNAQFAVSSPSLLADHVMYCLPPGTFREGGWIGYAYINGGFEWLSVYNDEWCTYVSLQMHELGHNMNLAHSNENENEITYQDQTGQMGFSYDGDDTPRMCFNAAKSFQLGWYTTTSQAADTWTLDQGNKDYALIGQVGWPNRNPVEKVVIKLDTPSSTDYYFMLNRATGSNSGTQEAPNQVIINMAGDFSAPSTSNPYTDSLLLAKMGAGQTYTITNFDGAGNDVDVIVNSIDLSANGNAGYAEITISTRNPDTSCGQDEVLECTCKTAAPSLFPTSSPTVGPSKNPSKAPLNPTVSPSSSPSEKPVVTVKPTSSPSKSPVTDAPTSTPSKQPSVSPSTSSPTPNLPSVGCVVGCSCIAIPQSELALGLWATTDQQCSQCGGSNPVTWWPCTTDLCRCV